MKRKLLFFCLCFCAFGFVKANNFIQPGKPAWIEQNAQCIFPEGTLIGASMHDISENAALYLKTILKDLKNENTGLLLTHQKESPHAKYFDYVETYRDYPIFGTAVKIGIDMNNKILSVVSKTADVTGWPLSFNFSVTNENRLKGAIGNFDSYNSKPTWFYDGITAVTGFEITCHKNDGTRSENLVLNSDYQVVYSNNLIKNYKYPDSLVTMYVFYPDPLTSARVPYAEPYTNHDDSDVTALDAQMQPKTTRVSVVNDSFILENEFLIETQLGAPYSPPTISKTPVFHYQRDTSAFRDIMIYYHLNNWRAHLKDLGYDSLGHSQIALDAQASGDDQSSFIHTGSSGPAIWFGLGGIPDAEDADIPYHEYTHFLSFSACPGCSESGTERGALDEGTADYFASSFSKSMSTYNWQKVYNWDGNVSGWSGRSCAIPDHYPEAMQKFGDAHLDGQLWSSALMQVWDSIGRTKTDAVMLETLYSLGKNLTMTDAAKLYIKADSLLYKGVDARVMAHFFIQRGFLPANYLGVAPINAQVGFKIITWYFASANKVLLDFEELQTGIATLYDITGKEIKSQSINSTGHIEFTAPEIAKGVYILNVNTNGMQKSFKLLK